MPNTTPTVYVLCDQNCKWESMTKEQIITAIAAATGTTPTSVDDGFITKIKETNANTSVRIWRGTEAQFNALSTKASDTFYLVTDNTVANGLMAAAYVVSAVNAEKAVGDKNGDDITATYYKKTDTVTNATNAVNATNATNASHATSADSATNVTGQINGTPINSFFSGTKARSAISADYTALSKSWTTANNYIQVPLNQQKTYEIRFSLDGFIISSIIELISGQGNFFIADKLVEPPSGSSESTCKYHIFAQLASSGRLTIQWDKYTVIQNYRWIASDTISTFQYRELT